MQRREVQPLPLTITLRENPERWPGTLQAADSQRWLVRLDPPPDLAPTKLVGRIVHIQFIGPGGLHTFASLIEQVVCPDPLLLAVRAPQQMICSDRRRYARLSRPLQVEGTIYGATGPYSFDTVTCNLCRVGIDIPVPGSVSVGDAVTLELCLPVDENPYIQAVGRVTNLRSLPVENPEGHVLGGIEFTEMPPEDAAQWLRYIAREERAAARQRAAA